MVERLKLWWRRLSVLPFGKCLFSCSIGLFIPYSGSIRPYVLELRPGFARVRLSDRRFVRNHLSSIHAIALTNLGELSTGLAVHFALKNSDRAILTSLSVKFIKKARGVITATAEIMAAESLPMGPLDVQARLRDESGVEVAQVTATWLIGQKMRS